MTLAFLLGAGLIFGALFIVFAAIGGFTPEKKGLDRSLEVLAQMTDSPEELTKEVDRPFAERVLDPLMNRLQGIGKRITGADQLDRIRERLDRAGNPSGWTVDRVASGKVLGLIVGFALGVFFSFALDRSLTTSIVLVGALTALGFMGPNIWLYNTAQKREEQMRKEMADAIDLMTISVEAGLGFDAALQQVARNTEGPLAEEFSRLLQEMQIGRGRGEALRGLGERTHLPEMRAFTSAMVQADAFGIPIGQVLRVQSSELRTKRRQRAEEKAAQVPVKIMIPVVLFILPCLLLIVMGPGIIGIIDSFSR